MLFPVKLPRVKRDERRELKEWLTSLLPDGMSRNDVADELGFSRKTVSTMLNPDQPGFGNGFTMLLYLRLVGGVVDAPVESPGRSRLAALEAAVDLSGQSMTSALEDLAARIQRVENALGLPDAQATEGK